MLLGSVAQTGGGLRTPTRHKLGSALYRRVEAPVKKGGDATGPSPVDRGKCGTNIHLLSDGRSMPLGAAITGANAADGSQTGLVLQQLVVHPPEAESSANESLSKAALHGDGAYGNAPARNAADVAGFRMLAPSRGQTRLPGVGRIRSAVERCHAMLSQFGRVVRRWDRAAWRYLAWVQLAACFIFVRRGFVR